jgi:iron(III) transport system ATP-binding protein
MTAIDVSGLRKTFPGQPVPAMDGVSFTVRPGEMLALLGPSGCGKTTMLRSVAGLEKPDSGSVRLGERTVFDSRARISVDVHRRDVGMVFQSFALWPHLSARGNIAFPLSNRGLAAAERKRRVEEIAAMVDLNDIALRKRPGQLSGGQQQRVALARALVGEPSVVLFDEPLSSLDAQLREQLRVQLRTLHRQLGFTGIYVTHDLHEALVVGDRIAVMRHGRIEQIGTPTELFANPVNTGVARMAGMRHLCTARRHGAGWVSEEGAALDWTAGPVTGDHLDLYARPEQIHVRTPGRPAGAGKGIRLTGATIRHSVVVSGRTELVVELGGRLLHLSTPGDSAALAAGESISLALRGEEIRLFDSAGSPYRPDHDTDPEMITSNFS